MKRIILFVIIIKLFYIISFGIFIDFHEPFIEESSFRLAYGLSTQSALIKLYYEFDKKIEGGIILSNNDSDTYQITYFLYGSKYTLFNIPLNIAIGYEDFVENDNIMNMFSIIIGRKEDFYSLYGGLKISHFDLLYSYSVYSVKLVEDLFLNIGISFENKFETFNCFVGFSISEENKSTQKFQAFFSTNKIDKFQYESDINLFK
ncbi:hypothetical protein XO10_07945 [Marinitoga sp. 1135]|uniref:hypothetical protein n=1 Tax=unclassified Marinitoga TaxID=2640159 RepID=UPI00158681BC|nr:MULTISPECIES: hypothetical protein [unclassified Marinitoga]NUU96191.1 hypothetical protein [Marinitoga sp. 1135]NUU98099.1 hypothetical protein [Marinitoga sp. 1138]